MQPIRIGEGWNDQDLALFMTKLVQVPMTILTYKVDRLLGRVNEISMFEELKVFIYDGHDAETVPLLRWLNASNLDYPHPTVYAS